MGGGACAVLPMLESLSKREIFASMAMHALVSKALGEVSEIQCIAGPISADALRIADALIAELSKQQPAFSEEDENL